jgi:hypothetical protein
MTGWITATQDYGDIRDYIVQDQKERVDYQGSCGQAGLNRTKRTDGIGQNPQDRQEQRDKQDHTRCIDRINWTDGVICDEQDKWD